MISGTRRVALRSTSSVEASTAIPAASANSVATTTTTEARRPTRKRTVPPQPVPASASISTPLSPAQPRPRPRTVAKDDVIVISSDSEDDRRAAAKRKREKSLLQELERLKRQLAEKIKNPDTETSKKRRREDDDTDAMAEAARWRTKAAKFEKDAEQLRLKLEASEKEAQSLRSKNSIADTLRDHLECEICMETLWQPWALADCGHTFCQSCLISLFNDQKFACPTCRVAVLRRPLEIFAHKKIIRAVAGAAPPEVDMFADPQHVWDPIWRPIGSNHPPRFR